NRPDIITIELDRDCRLTWSGNTMPRGGPEKTASESDCKTVTNWFVTDAVRQALASPVGCGEPVRFEDFRLQLSSGENSEKAPWFCDVEPFTSTRKLIFDRLFPYFGQD